ncbi:MAG: porin family protein [Bdellovibrionaceae bacterium]|nr:porin family protein [Pseudobdellovibrionaceae bacterium]MDW8189368.1 hypothetical protein [Pseudobdellovibrionaceae bacterium]
MKKKIALFVFSTLFPFLSHSQIMGEELVPQKPDINGVVVLPDGRRCRAVVEMNQDGQEVTRLIECEGYSPKSKANRSDKFNLDDGNPHYNFKIGVLLDPRAGFNMVMVGNNITKADMAFNETLSFELEYGYFNKYAWNFIVGAGFDLAKKAKETVYNFGQVNPQPIMNYTTINIYLNLYRALEYFYFMLGLGYFIPQANFDEAKSSNARGDFGYRLELGHHFHNSWSIYLGYRWHNFEADAIALNNNNFNYRKGFYSDYQLGFRYFFR